MKDILPDATSRWLKQSGWCSVVNPGNNLVSMVVVEERAAQCSDALLFL
jgi:hypothetical protein